MIFQVCPVYVQKMQEKVSKSWNMDKSGLGKYVTINFGHFLWSCNPFWRSGGFLDTIGPLRSVCPVSFKFTIHSFMPFLRKVLQLSYKMFSRKFFNNISWKGKCTQWYMSLLGWVHWLYDVVSAICDACQKTS